MINEQLKDVTRVLVVADRDTGEWVFVSMIYDPFFATVQPPYVTTDEAVRDYLDEFCSDCYIRSNKLNNGPLTDQFNGRVCLVSLEESTLKEYEVRILTFNKDERNSSGAWDARRAAYSKRGFDDRVAYARGEYKAPEQAEQPQVSFMAVYFETLFLVSFAILITGLFHIFTSDSSDDGTSN